MFYASGGGLNVRFIGIGGISMSALAKLTILKGHTVTGSDLSYSKRVEELNEWGVTAVTGSDPSAVDSADLVVFNAAVPADDPELSRAIELNKRRISRAAFLGEIAAKYPYTVSVAGTHGKTTVTGMLASIFDCYGEAFTAHIGGELPGFGNLVYRGDNLFLTEACEYRRSFLRLNSDIAIVLNVEFDHPDCYRNLSEVYEAFENFTSDLKPGGTALINADSEFYRMRKCAYKNALGFSVTAESDFRAVDISLQKNGCFGFRIKRSGYPNIDIELSVPGYHNVYNALAAAAAALIYKVLPQDIYRGLKRFTGIKGRFEYLMSFGGARIYADYAHHPTEIRAALQTALSLHPKRLIAVFQPHTYTRTAALADKFIYSFCDADAVFVFKEFAARETGGGMTAFELYNEMRNVRDGCFYYGDLLSLGDGLKKFVAPGDVVMLIGAGDVKRLADIL
ncbi:MAG TPA: UDP-N-acetylmuramate--L-alanine ligase [Candidatus Stercoripulliclostridium merdigallinarum]|uniref:UDP-N-acetylmuramate--L-alanine ligase n=1 Tax=Candidatus Stercoripulliclostridium merdigallinarum TaxID=2840951 RepID=A0A9D1MI92_9FIRM|nr:UDP-N-acetylmuramate--L-alanine ligase [Candidatus Stercoripulliclostridium merdigallinarum]